MTTYFKNFRFPDNKGDGFIFTETELLIWDCVKKEWSPEPPVVYRNNLLFGNHPYHLFIIGKIPKSTRNPGLLNEIVFEPGLTFELDLASNSRTHGRFTFANKPVGDRYFGRRSEDNWRRIIYGSILHTTCRQLYYAEVGYVIADDENRLPNGTFLDDPINRIHWETSDSHGKASTYLMRTLSQDDNPNQPVQFRIAAYNYWSAKGTLTKNTVLDRTDASRDLVLTLSSFKGNKPPLGNYRDRLLMGTVQDAFEGVSNPGWMLWQWFTFKTLEKDGIISTLRARCHRLSKTAKLNNVKAIADLFRIQIEESDGLEIPHENIIEENVYVDNLVKIIQADRDGILLRHPYVIQRIEDRVQGLWISFAKTCGIRARRFMTQPDEYFKRSYDQGFRAFCCASLPPGKYIVYPFPMRHWGDVQIWWNTHSGIYANSPGTMATCLEQYAELGRDFDGDPIQIMDASKFPHITEAIENFGPVPPTDKPSKVPIEGTLQEIAVDSMTNLTGVCATLLARIQAADLFDVILRIPAGGDQLEERQIAIGIFVGDQLQIAVDSLKSARPNNEAGLQVVTDFLNEVESFTPWIKDLKAGTCYRDRPCNVSSDARDVVSDIIRIVNFYWKPIRFTIDEQPRSFHDVLFAKVPTTADMEQHATQYRDWYRTQMREVLDWKRRNGGSSVRVRLLVASAKDHWERLLTDSGIAAENWAAAFWRATHKAESGTAGLVFNICLPQILAELSKGMSKARPLDVYNVQKGSFGANFWWGQNLYCEVYTKKDGGRSRLAIAASLDSSDSNRQFLGYVADRQRSLVSSGMKFETQIYSYRYARDGQTNGVWLIPKSEPDSERQRLLWLDIGIYTFNREQYPEIYRRAWNAEILDAIAVVAGEVIIALKVVKEDGSIITTFRLFRGHDTRFIPNRYRKVRILETERNSQLVKLRIFEGQMPNTEIARRINAGIPPYPPAGGTVN